MAGSGGAWKVAYADFVTAMMAFFLVMWIVAQNKPVKEAVASYFRDPTGRSVLPGKNGSLTPNKEGGGSPTMIGPIKGATGRSKSDSGVRPSEDPDGVVAVKTSLLSLQSDERTTVGTVVPFAEDSAELNDQGKQVLDTLAPALLGKMFKIEVRGHASGRPLPSDSPFHDAWELSYVRSMNTMKYLAEKGVELRRFRLSQGGPNDPNPHVRDPSVQQNSRVELYALSEILTDRSATREKKDRPKKPAAKRPRPKAQEQANKE
jgi:chemotaxis protein MotB